MATYAELAGITNESGWSEFVDKIRVAALIKAAAIITSTTPAESLLNWAKGTIAAPGPAANSVAFYVVAANASLTIATILSATDSQIQDKVDEAVDALYGA